MSPNQKKNTPYKSEHFNGETPLDSKFKLVTSIIATNYRTITARTYKPNILFLHTGCKIVATLKRNSNWIALNDAAIF